MCCSTPEVVESREKSLSVQTLNYTELLYLVYFRHGGVAPDHVYKRLDGYVIAYVNLSPITKQDEAVYQKQTGETEHGKKLQESW
jgi:hypothetical protein